MARDYINQKKKKKKKRIYLFNKVSESETQEDEEIRTLFYL
jgi:hypothetical protein